jgi:YD repeat-containing protein
MQVRSTKWAPLDLKRFRQPESHRTEYSYAKFGRIYAVHVTAARATQFRMQSPVIRSSDCGFLRTRKEQPSRPPLEHDYHGGPPGLDTAPRRRQISALADLHSERARRAHERPP